MAFVGNYTALLSPTSSWNQPSNGPYVPKAVFLTYSFAETRPPLSYGVDYGEAGFFRALDGREQRLFEQALDAWASVSGIRFLRAPSGQGDIEAGIYDLAEGIWGQAHLPSSGFYSENGELRMYAPGGDNYQGVFLDKDGGANLSTMLHEIGHALGLEHPHDGTEPLLNPAMDHGANTVMTYRANPTALGQLDKQAIQALYGSAAADGTQVADWSWDAATATLTQHGSALAETLNGTNAHDVIYARGGDDIIVLRAGDDVAIVSGEDFSVAGGDGLDRVEVDFSREAIRDISLLGDSLHLLGSDNSWDMYLTQVERFVFSDGTLAFDLEGNAGQAYRIYQAGFARTPDNDGLRYWIDRMDGGTLLHDVASGFVSSQEFAAVYGSDASHADFVDRLYENVLGRDGEVDGVAFWVHELEYGLRDMADVLADFAESPENIARVSPAIDDGIWYS